MPLDTQKNTPIASPIIRDVTIGDCRLIQGDCLEVMPLLGEFDAVVTDPPYGIGADKNLRANKKQGKAAAPSKDYGIKNWDAAPPKIDWIFEHKVPSIVWGGNYFSTPPNSCWLVWDKQNGSNGYADCELAWTNLDGAVRRIYWRWAGMLQKEMGEKKEVRVHPTQKPVGVMEWCIKHLPKTSRHTLDPFMGSGTTGVACVKLGRKFTGIELDPDYFDIAADRIRKAYEQPDMFIAPPSKPIAHTQESFDLDTPTTDAEDAE